MSTVPPNPAAPVVNPVAARQQAARGRPPVAPPQAPGVPPGVPPGVAQVTHSVPVAPPAMPPQQIIQPAPLQAEPQLLSPGAPPTSAAPQAAAPPVKKGPPKKSPYYGLAPNAEGNPTQKLSAAPVDYDRKKNERLKKDNFLDEVHWYDWAIGQHDIQRERMVAEQADIKLHGSTRKKKMKERAAGLAMRLADIQSNCADAGITAEEIGQLVLQLQAKATAKAAEEAAAKAAAPQPAAPAA